MNLGFADDPVHHVDVVMMHQGLELVEQIISHVSDMCVGETPQKDIVFLHSAMVAAEQQLFASGVQFRLQQYVG